MNEPIAELNQLIINEFKTNVIDVYVALALKSQLNKEYGIGDGVHLSISGYIEVGRTVYRTLSKFFKQ